MRSIQVCYEPDEPPPVGVSQSKHGSETVLSRVIDSSPEMGKAMSDSRPGRRIKVMQLGSPTGLYGAERWILALVRHLNPAAVESVVASIRDAPHLTAPLCSVAESLGFRSVVFDAPGRVNWAAVRQLRRYVVDNGVQILHTHGYKTDVIGLLATRATPCRLVSTPHGWSVRAGFALRVYEAIDRGVFPFFDAVAPLSEALCDELKRTPGVRSKLQLIRNGVDISEIDAAQQVAEELEAWKREGNFIVGYIGQLIPRKGLRVLLKAFSRMTTPKKKLVFLGEGAQREELERLANDLKIAEHVSFFGFREDRLAFLRGFDVFVLPSSLEGIPRCLMEAMAARVAVVASNIPGCTDLVSDGDTGFLFKLDSEDALAARLDDLANLSDVRNAVARRGRAFVVANYSAATMAATYERLYSALVQGQTGRT